MDCTPWRICLRWPFAVAVELGGYFLRLLVVRPGKFLIRFLLSALDKVDGTGEKRVACEKRTISFAFAVSSMMAKLLWCCGGSDSKSAFVLLFRSSCQSRLVALLRWPLMIVSPWYFMCTLL